MAAYAAHLTRTRGGAPSVFQLAAQEALAHTVKPALRRLVEYLSSVYPGGCGWLQRWYDEVYLMVDLWLQHHYLQHYAASFSESFYGLCRSPLAGASSQISHGTRLSATQETASLAAMVLLPYLVDKVTNKVELWRDMEEDGQLGKTSTARLRRLAIHLHTISHLVVTLGSLLQLWRYLSGSSRCHNLQLRLLGLTLTEAPPADGESFGWGEAFRGLRKGDWRSCILSLPPLGATILSFAQWAAFGVQCLRSMAGQGQGQGGTEQPLLPPPPPPVAEAAGARWRNKCPLCLHAWRVPTVLPVSGLVFCYVCISRHVRAHRSCPVTQCPASEQQLVRMYADGDLDTSRD